MSDEKNYYYEVHDLYHGKNFDKLAKVLVIYDKCLPSKKSVTNDTLNILREIFRNDEISKNKNLKKIIYKDSMGIFDEIIITDEADIEIKCIGKKSLSEAFKVLSIDLMNRKAKKEVTDTNKN